MDDKIEVLGIRMDPVNVDAAMERTAGFLQTDTLNTVGIITMNALLAAAESPVMKEYLEQLDLGVIGESEVLEAAGITSGQIYEETENNEFIARLFWKLITGSYSFFLLGESQEEVSALHIYVKETYPDITVSGQTWESEEEEHSADWIVNEINGSGAAVILSGLKSSSQAAFLLENRSKINGKIWLSLGEQLDIQNEAGIKNTWFGTFLKKNSFRRKAAKFHNTAVD